MSPGAAGAPEDTIILVTILAGIHPVHEALKARRPLERVLVAKGAGGQRLQEIIDLCRTQRIPIRFEQREALDRASSTPAHQGVVAIGAMREYQGLDSVIGAARLLVVLDGVEDPHNLGAIIRTANAAGADAVLFPERRAASLTDTVAKASAGAIEYTPLVRIGNVSQAIEKLKKAGHWIYGLDERGTVTYDQVDFAVPTVFVLGGEGKGVHQHVREHCDMLIRIPTAGEIASLNVSVAAGIILFQWRHRTETKG
jgi:23S rRNA (guanosine2251-2'-O)-methyltransferase